VPFDAIEEGCTVVQVNARQRSTACTALRQRYARSFWSVHRASKYELKPLLNKRRECGLSLNCFGASSLQQRRVQANGGSHMS